MSGIDLTGLDSFIKKNENILSSVNVNSERVVSSLKDLGDCYEGKALDKIFSVLCSQDMKFNSIMPVLDSYLSLLKNVRKNYVLQDISLSQHINKMEIKHRN